MIQFDVNKRAMENLSRVLDGNAKKLRREVRIAVNETAKHVHSQWAKEITQTVAITQKTVKAMTKLHRADNDGRPSAKVVQKENERPSLKEFKAKQTRQGITYRISKTGKGRSKIKSAFIPTADGPRRDAKTGRFVKRTRTAILGGHAYKRKGKSRLPIVKLKGVSPWGVSVVNRIPKKLKKLGSARLLVEIKKRIRFLNLKKSGVI